MANELAKLTAVPLREAWPDEARDFTPWLHENLDRLSEALGMELEPMGTEVSVEGFRADLIATDARTGGRVLIENQLYSSDHAHLGAILTYLAGVEAQSIVWIAKGFHSAHLSAVRWLNENTSTDFAFFALRVRVVRIGDSLPAPLLEVVEKPDSWGRELGRAVRKIDSELTRLRQSFWNRYIEKYPRVFGPSKHSNVWVPMLDDKSIYLSMYVGSQTSGMFLRGPHGTDGEALAVFMEKHRDALDGEFGPSQSQTAGYYYGIDKEISVYERERWDELIEWMEEHRCRFKDALQSVAQPDQEQ